MNRIVSSDACERNKGPILEILKQEISGPLRILEIGSGTGQHVEHFAAALPDTTWQPSDRRDFLADLCLRPSLAELDNILEPIELDVTNRSLWPAGPFDVIYTANTAHIMSAPAVADMFELLGSCLKPGGKFLQYGPFKYSCAYTAPSNEQFDGWLKDRDPAMGLRDVAWLQLLGQEQGLTLETDHPMPANNNLLVWKKA